uniref:Uncharacterized protein n=1 Tax=Trypanosoma vivax (strain Y486) TaxID=1055687 RepID=G0TYZ0_TRYVY|nr:hypothetical protein TVY486_0705200 [Trypanosoma vivax Y486]
MCLHFYPWPCQHVPSEVVASTLMKFDTMPLTLFVCLTVPHHGTIIVVLPPPFPLRVCVCFSVLFNLFHVPYRPLCLSLTVCSATRYVTGRFFFPLSLSSTGPQRFGVLLIGKGCSATRKKEGIDILQKWGYFVC